ncbi:hypothetical protein [Mycolicibacterium sp.]|uniref:hypothetical protein n=1 Tax=Mycolicibacterium sp. TaxID=2320850 RepID=UPI0025EE07ED|nr:hypothetical protein [Mycolicibacterium sp.]MCB9410226.1 hypothetical protein [Mycolicibacterium sp.]
MWEFFDQSYGAASMTSPATPRSTPKSAQLWSNYCPPVVGLDKASPDISVSAPGPFNCAWAKKASPSSNFSATFANSG